MVQASQIFFGVLIIIVLVGMAGFFGWRQLLTLRTLRKSNEFSEEDRRYMRRQAWRRLTCSAIMVILAAMLALHYTLEPTANALARQKELNPAHEFTPAERDFTRTYAVYWGTFLLLLLTLVFLAGVDFFAIRRFGIRHYRQIQADRRAMIEGELTRIRSQRNGHG